MDVFTLDNNEEYPPVKQLTDNYLHDGRVNDLIKLFENKFNQKPAFLVRVPGRVNLIGEHIDYCGYSVCPMAIQRDILLAVAISDTGLLQLTNVDAAHGDFKCDIDTFNIEANKGDSPAWYNYFLCGLKGVLEILAPGICPVAMNVAVSGNIPLGSGLSSSSALVSAAALAAAHANKLILKKVDIASLCAQSERYIGTQGGGMDQAIAFLGTRGSAKHIEFNPLRATDIKLPHGAVFVIAHSLSIINKAATADYNCRVAECRLAGQVIAKKHALKWKDVKRLSDLQKLLGLKLEEMSNVVKDSLHEEPYTKSEICSELEVSEDELHDISLTNNTTHITVFKLQQRALHVFQEADRVKKFCSACHSDANYDEILQQLGDLMRESHHSLQHLFECSHPLLDEVVSLSADVSLGCRLTGAGWGGCAIALTTQDNYEKYIEKLKTLFYEKRSVEEVNSFLFATEPSDGAAVYSIS